MEVYTAYGEGIRSDFAFGALFRMEQHHSPTTFEVIRLDVLQPPPAVLTKLSRSQGRNIYIRVEDCWIRVRIGSFLDFEIWPSENKICCKALGIVPDELLRYWVVQQILPLFLLWKGTAEFLHGMAVSSAADGQTDADRSASSSCIGFLGDSFAGKSTLLSYFLGRGHALVADDHLAIARTNYRDVLPATPYYRPYRAGEDLGQVAARFSPAPTALKHLFVLEPAPAYAEIEVDTPRGMAALSAVLPHVQYNLHNPELPQLFPLVEERFRGLNQLARQVPIKRLHVPRDLNRLPEVYDRIQKEVAS